MTRGAGRVSGTTDARARGFRPVPPYRAPIPDGGAAPRKPRSAIAAALGALAEAVAPATRPAPLVSAASSAARGSRSAARDSSFSCRGSRSAGKMSFVMCDRLSLEFDDRSPGDCQIFCV